MINRRVLIDIYDKDRRFVAPLDGFEAANLALRTHEIGTVEITIPESHRRAADLHTTGTRLRVYDADTGGHMLSGPIRPIKGQGPTRSSMLTVRAEDDLRILWSWLAWVRPQNPASLQGDDTAYYTLSGPAETVAKTVLTANLITRLGLPVSIPATQGRGSSIKISARFNKLADLLIPAVIDAGIILTCQQSGGPTGTVTLDARTPVTNPRVLYTDSGEVTDWSYELTGPEVTRGVAGGQGEGTARVFRSYVNTAEESAWGPLAGGETFEDQRQESLAASLDAALQAEVNAKASKGSVSITLTETPTWRYGTARKIGDRVTASIIPGQQSATYLVTAADLTYNVTDGWSATTTVGRNTGRQITAVLADTARRVRRLETT